MALEFKNTKGKAIKGAEAYNFVEGEQTIRLFGGILPRYLYWLKGTNNKDIPIECLAFDRKEEKFNNKETDNVQKYFPDVKCSWAYSSNCIDPKDGKDKVFNFKKKLFEQILTAADDLGDPTDPDEGWDITFKKVKTGPHQFNVEYTLMVLRCKKRPLTEAERETVKNAQSIDQKYPRPSVAEVQVMLDKLSSGESADEPTSAEREAIQDLP